MGFLVSGQFFGRDPRKIRRFRMFFPPGPPVRWQLFIIFPRKSNKERCPPIFHWRSEGSLNSIKHPFRVSATWDSVHFLEKLQLPLGFPLDLQPNRHGSLDSPLQDCNLLGLWEPPKGKRKSRRRLHTKTKHSRITFPILPRDPPFQKTSRSTIRKTTSL